MLCFPNCKINIGLYITSRRADGYHNLETFFYPLPVTDALEVVPAAATELHVSGLDVPGQTADNLVLKAWELLHNDFGERITPVAIHLLKQIPMGAGLGGGSADGAFMLRLMNDYYQLGLPHSTLERYALQLGSDCPFFIANEPGFASGRGEELTPLPVSLKEYDIQLICPEVHVSTREAFGMLQPRPAPTDLRTLPQIPVTEWKAQVHNDFEGPVFARHPVLQSIKDQLYAGGAVYASMSGSGSALYGIFHKGERATIQANVPYREVYVTELA